MERVSFADLVGADRDPTPDQRAWLAELAGVTDPQPLTVGIGGSGAAVEPGPIVACDPDGTWRAGRYVGEVVFAGKVLEIRPRLGIETLAHWAGAAQNLRILPEAGSATTTDGVVTEFVAAIWRAAVVGATRHGLPGLRSPRTDIGGMVRGRIDVPTTLRLRAAGRPHVASVSRPKQLDNPVARVIVRADAALDQRIGRSDWRGERLEELMPRLRAAVGARPALPTARELAAVRYTPITLPYRRVAALSYQIARGRGLVSRALDDTADGLLIDVAELWELFVLHCARRAFGSAHVTHGAQLETGRHLLRSARCPGRGWGRMYPDVIVGPVEHPVAIIDAKYKPLAPPREVDRADLYQLNAYLSAQTQTPVPTGMLAYVDFPGGRTASVAEACGPWHSSAGHTALFTRLPTTENACIARLRELVPAAVR